MKHSFPFTNRSLLLLLTSAMAACSGEDASNSQHADTSDAATGGTAGTSGSGGTATTTGGVGGTGGSGGSSGGAVGTGGSATGGTAGTGGAMRDASADAISDADSNADASCPPGMEPAPGGGCRYATVRRPFLVGASMRSAESAVRTDWMNDLAANDDALDEPTRTRLAAMWLKDALEEHASVAAFARFTLQLLSLGAPPDLVVRSQQASLDEVRHAKSCFALASRYGRETYGPAGLRVDDAVQASSLAEVARLTAEEGCVGETLGAILAREQLGAARDPAVLEALRKIAADEARHAELAWRFVRWAMRSGDAGVTRAIVEGIERAITATLAMEIVGYSDVDIGELHAHGRLTCTESRAVAKRAIEEVVRPCLRALLGDVNAPSHSGDDKTHVLRV